MNAWLTTILIFLPVAGALVLFVVPLRAYWAASFALLVSLVEVGFWIEAVETTAVRPTSQSEKPKRPT